MSGSYEAIGWLPASSVLSLADLEARVRDSLPGWTVSVSGKTVQAIRDGWRIRWHLADEPHVAEEAEEFCEDFADNPKVAGLAGCRARVEIHCPDPDPGMDYFNDYVSACQAVEDVPGIVLFDPLSAEFI